MAGSIPVTSAILLGVTMPKQMRVTALGHIALILKPYVDVFRNRDVRHAIQRAIVDELHTQNGRYIELLKQAKDRLHPDFDRDLIAEIAVFTDPDRVAW